MIKDPEELIDQGRYLEAISYLKEIMGNTEELRPKQLFALCLSKSGSPDAARDFLQPVYDRYPDDAETAGILGSIYKELFKKNQQSAFAAKSRDTYLKNFIATKNYYTGINAASMSAIMMQASKSRDLAKEVMSLIPGNTQDFWQLCTLGEACLLAKDKERSIMHYLNARKLADNDWGKIASAYNQLWLLNHFIPVPSEILRIFNPPAVIAFSGHMVDPPDRYEPRFPDSIAPKIKEAISSHILTMNAHIGYCSLACGGDILFAEAMAETEGEVNIILPFNEEDFIRESVLFGGKAWMERYKNLKENFTVRFITHEPYDGHDELFSAGSKIILGEAVMRSKTFNSKPHLLTVLSETDMKRKRGGTRDIISAWPFPETHVNINPDLFYGSVGSMTQTEETAKPASRTRPLLYMLKLDLSKLSIVERERIRKDMMMMINAGITPVHEFPQDNQMMVFGFEGLFAALDLTGSISQKMKALPPGQYVKIAVNVGPVDLDSSPEDSDTFQLLDEIISLANPGTICAIEYMAAMYALEINKFRLDYAGSFVSKRLKESFALYNIKGL